MTGRAGTDFRRFGGEIFERCETPVGSLRRGAAMMRDVYAICAAAG